MLNNVFTQFPKPAIHLLCLLLLALESPTPPTIQLFTPPLNSVLRALGLSLRQFPTVDKGTN